ncbi:MAG TPA: hypothetical protein VF173_19895 [Thermoanaerobaculia bacterium]|nr:hypothetical protein [Thermoanaerobaculia bacterium]
MSSYRLLRTGVVVAVLLVLLVVAGTPAQAQPVRPVRESVSRVAGLGEQVRHFVAVLWARIFAPEGMSIDPNGANSVPGVPSNPTPPATPNEGMTIDPDGRT